MMFDQRDVAPIKLYAGSNPVPLSVVPPGVSITGLCPGQSIIVGSLVVAGNAQVALSDLTLQPDGAQAAPLQVSPDASVTMR
jgi:hypothetical protein